MEFLEPKGSKDMESAKIKVYHLITQCLQDIEKTVRTAGFTMRDIGLDVEKYNVIGDSFIVEMKLNL